MKSNASEAPIKITFIRQARNQAVRIQETVRSYLIKRKLNIIIKNIEGPP